MFAFSFNFLPQRFASDARKSSFVLLFFAAFLALSAAPNFAQTETDGTLRKQAAKAMRKGEFAEAEKIWRVLLDGEPDNYKYRLALSHSLYKQRFLVESYNEARKVADAEPKNARAFALIGSSLLSAGNFKQAKEAFYAALSLNEEEPLALAGAAMLDFHENRAAWGFARIRLAIQLEPREPDFVYYLAQVAVRTEKYNEAAQAYENFLQIAPNTDVDRRERIKGLISFLRYLGAQSKLFAIEGKRQTAIKMEIVNNRPIITVKINEHDEPLRFVLDSGSAVTVLSDTTAKRLGIKEVARGGKARAIGGEGKFNIVYGFLNSLHIGDVKINKVPVYIRKFYNRSEAIDGYIGISLISKFLTTVDYGNQVFSLVRQEKKENKKTETDAIPSNPDGLSIPLRITTSGFLSGEVKIDSVPEALNFIIDTGASVSVVSSVTTKYYQLNRFAEPTIMSVFGAAGITENVTALNLPRLDFGLHSQEKIQAAVLDLDAINETSGFEQSGILGGNFLKNYRLTFDFVNVKIVLEPSLPQKIKNATDAIVSENIKPRNDRE
ncbi:MAG TPA: aspartyl protease family protein [Pyrinomonadaceae bacterium]|jgi:tetratricopeptide (TPR) repeat protein